VDFFVLRDLQFWSSLTIEQGGIFTEDQVREAQQDPLLQAKLSVRRWDDMAKVPNMDTLPLEYYERLATKSLLGKCIMSGPNSEERKSYFGCRLTIEL